MTIFKHDDAHEQMRLANSEANEFARTGLANLILLNGGALVAMAPIGGMFGIKISDVFYLTLLSAGAFCAGLILALLAFLCGFLVNSDLSRIFFWNLTIQQLKVFDSRIIERGQLVFGWLSPVFLLSLLES